ncbi:MAG: PQQ-dependent sugar dehydrogenase [Anaerolineae bacterium]|nr:PQQ-dependent sugar dehydrogenase [Anaerolineae bacterium]
MTKFTARLAVLILFLSACAPAATPMVTTSSPAVLPSPVVVSATQSPEPVDTPAPEPTAQSIVPSSQQPAGVLTLPAGFGIGVFADGLAQPRMLAVGPDGMLYAAERGAGRIVRLPDRNNDGAVDTLEVVASGLNAPNSLAFYKDGSLYVAETTRVLRLSQPDASGVYSQRDEIITGLPSGGHSTRTLLFSPDASTLYVSVGSSCNVCNEQDERRATIMAYNPDGSGGRVYARGLRNAVGIVFRPGSNELWASNNGRDNLGDEQPPETVYRVKEGANYGWPICHAGRIVDPDFGSADSCSGVETPQIEMGAHMAPLGINFYTGNNFPDPYRRGLFITLHGSWNSTVPVGYKVMWSPIQADGSAGAAEDFISGWLTPNGNVWGRPVDVVNASDGSLFISDDRSGVIYRVYYRASEGA